VPYRTAWSPDDLLAGKGDRARAELLRKSLAANDKPGRPLEMLYENSTLGTLASDKTGIYCIDDNPVPSREAEAGGPDHNELLGICRYRGILVWKKKSTEVPGTTGLSYFLGPPLPYAINRLYVLHYTEADGKGAVNLLCLDGLFKLPDVPILWSAPVAGGLELLSELPWRRAQAAHVARSGNLLVCPTNAGVITAINETTHRPAWSYTYRAPGTPPVPYGAGWTVTAPIIHDNKVVFAAPDSDWLYCLRLEDGKELWKVPRSDSLFLAGLTAEHAVLAGGTSCRAVRLSDGKPAWQTATGVPSGQGQMRGNTLYLPVRQDPSTGKPAILAVDVARGAVTSRMPWPYKELPGNLVLAGDYLVSQGLEQIRVCELKRE
jgi:outer membrane protein assembly factor BamB